VRDYVKAGKVAEVPSAVDVDRFTPSVVKTATFQLSWDQALPSTSADPLLTTIDKVFPGQLEPERFGQEMSKVAGS
jgi:raffinose/stachyose/melibiose transport system substrate-binding protein